MLSRGRISHGITRLWCRFYDLSWRWMNISFCPGGAIRGQSAKNYTKYFCPKKTSCPRWWSLSTANPHWQAKDWGYTCSQLWRAVPRWPLCQGCTCNSVPRQQPWVEKCFAPCTGKHRLWSRKRMEEVCREPCLFSSLIYTLMSQGKARLQLWVQHAALCRRCCWKLSESSFLASTTKGHKAPIRTWEQECFYIRMEKKIVTSTHSKSAGLKCHTPQNSGLKPLINKAFYRSQYGGQTMLQAMICRQRPCPNFKSTTNLGLFFYHSYWKKEMHPQYHV